MSQGTVMIQAQNRQFEKDFTVATPEEFVRRFKGNRVINKVSCAKFLAINIHIKAFGATAQITGKFIFRFSSLSFVFQIIFCLFNINLS